MTFRVGGKPHYQLFIELASDTDPNLANVQSVEYTLHPTFKNRVRTSTDRGQNFRIEIKAWGTFVVKVTVTTTDGKKQDFNQSMKDGWSVSYL